MSTPEQPAPAWRDRLAAAITATVGMLRSGTGPDADKPLQPATPGKRIAGWFTTRLTLGARRIGRFILAWVKAPDEHGKLGTQVARGFGVLIGGGIAVYTTTTNPLWIALDASLALGACLAASHRDAEAWMASKLQPRDEKVHVVSIDQATIKTATIGGLRQLPAGQQATGPNGTAILDASGQLPAGVQADDQPFPLAIATDGVQAAEALRRALLHEGLKIAAVEPGTRYKWGWEIPVIQREGVPGHILAKAGDLETLLDLPEDGLLVQPTRERRARSIVRAIMSDPFADQPPFPLAPVGSASVNDEAAFGDRMDGVKLKLSPRGKSILIVGVSGGGKSWVMRALAAWLACACRDAVVWDADPIKSGLDELDGAISRTAREPDEIVEMLADMVKIASARARLRLRLGMRETWEPSPEYPSLYGFVDEYPQLPDEAKELAVQVLRVGRQCGVHLVVGTQDSTKPVLGAAIADSVAVSIMLPARHADIPLVFGPGAIASGWRPDRLHPSPGPWEPADAGKCYVKGAGYNVPLLYKFMPLAADDAQRWAAQRAEVGLPRLDAESLNAAGVRLADTGRALTLAERVAATGPDGRLLAALLAVFDAHPGEDWMPTTEVILPALAERGHQVTPAKLRVLLGGEGKDRRPWPGAADRVAGYTRDAVTAAARKAAEGRP